MNIFTIKIIAIVTMLIDHVGLFLFPENLTYRVIGRISYPLFAWMIANGAKHTKNIDKYILRLFLFGIITQIPYYLAMQNIKPSFYGLNALFTLGTGLLGIKFIEKFGLSLKSIALMIPLAVGLLVTNSEYDLVGFLSIVFFYIYMEDFGKLVFSQTFLFLVLWYLLIFIGIKTFHIFRLVQPVALVSLPIIGSYNKKLGPRAKYLFYIVYPLQFVVFLLLLS